EFDKFATKEGESLDSVHERAKKAAKNHDPLALFAYSNASSSHSHANSSYSPQPYYVTHPPSVVDYDDEYQGELQGDSQEDKFTTAMMLLARGETELKGSIQEMQMMKAIRLFSVFHELSLLQAKQIEQMLLAMNDEARSNLSNEENDFMLDTSYGEDLEELTAAVIGCSKHMTGNLQLLRNFVEKFMGTVRFGNDHFAAITSYGDYVKGNLTIFHVYYVEGLRHNLFSVGQFYTEI
ncbi:hypothetical protein Tco_1526703, partial [Tanacetum coccineum]